jgi:hypothetical protein
MPRAWWFVCVAAAIGVTACSSAESSTFDSGLPPDKPVVTLSDGEVVSVCEDVEDFFIERFDVDQIARLYCTYGGINAAVLQIAECESYVASCVENPPIVVPPVTEGSYGCGMLTAADLAACDNTIGEIEACLNEIATNFDALGGVITCSLVDEADWMARVLAAWSEVQGSACAALDPDCPFAPDGPALPL